MRVGGYIRVSSADQVDNYSLDSQERLLRDYCEYRGLPEPVIYREAGKSAFNDNPHARPQFAALLRDAQERRIDTVLVIDLDRFARSALAALLAKRELEDCGCRLVSLNQGIDFSSPDGGLMFTINSGFSEYYSKQLSRKVRAGNEQKRRQGLHVGGVPWAARRVAGLLEPIPERLTIVRLVLELAARHGLHTTAVIMNERGIPSPRGVMWSANTVRYMIDEGGEWLRATGGEWGRLLDAARANRKAPSVRSDRQVRTLSGLMHCCCGGRIHYSTPSRRPDGSVVHTLHCRNKDRAQIVACGRRRTHAEWYEAMVEAWLLDLPDLSRQWETTDDSGPQRARIAESRRRAKRAYFDRHELRDEEYDALIAELDAQERALPAEPLTLKTKAEGIAAALEEWAEWEAPARNLFLRSILEGVIFNGRLILPVPKPDIRRMIVRAETL